MQRQRISQAGFSMVELMVALVLGIILMGGVVSVYISSRSSYNTNNSLGEVEQGGRYALDFMEPILTLAGYAGCSRPSSSKLGTGSTGASSLNFANNMITGTGTGNTIVPVYNFGSTVFGYEANGTNIGQSIPTSGSGVQTATAAPVPPQSASDWTPSLTWKDSGSVLYNVIKSTALQYSDILMVHEALGSPVPLVGPTWADNSALYVTPSTTTNVPATAANFSANEFAIESGCFNNNTVPYTLQVSSVTGSSGTLNYSGAASIGNTGSLLNTAGGSNYVQVQPVNTYVFYVGSGADGWPALFEASFGTSGSTAGTFQTEQLVSGVENMQVLYGVDTSSDQIPDNFQTADTVQSGDQGANLGGLWGNVVSVRIAMVVESDNYSVDKSSTSATTYYMLGTGSSDSVTFTAPNDQRLRRYFIQTFSFRNLLP